MPSIPPMAEPFECRESWRDGPLAEFEAFLRDPRLLRARPPLTRKANYR
jgi:hypothetical protein